MVADALYKGFHCGNELIDRAMATPLISEDDGNEASFGDSLKNVSMYEKKFPKGRKITNKVKVGKGEFNLISNSDDGGVSIDEYKYKEYKEYNNKFINS